MSTATDPSGDVRDVVVVGAGHNALVAACYLAKAGLSVEVVERDTVVGGAVSTVERWPGYAVDRGSSLHIMIRRTGIVEELELARYGLHYLDCDPFAFLPVPGAPGGGLTFSRDLDATCASIEAICGGRDADAYRRFVAAWGPRNHAVFDAFHGVPTPGRIGRALWRAGRGSGLDGLELARQFLQPGDQLLEETFDSELLRGALAWLGAQSGPPLHEAGTADLVGWVALLHELPPGRPVGGSGALTQALARRLAADGGVLRTGTPATALTAGADGRVDGVVLEGGERIPARAVMAGCHLEVTWRLLEPLLPGVTLAGYRRALRVGAGMGMVARVAARALPVFPGAPEQAQAGMTLLADRPQLRAAYGDYLQGRPPERPPVLSMAPTVLEPALAPPGRHTLSLWSQWHPAVLADGRSWDALAEREGEKLVAEVERRAPGFAAGVEDVFVQTPAQIERELALPRGNVMHLEMTLDAMFSLRPLPSMSGYRGPVAGLYLCGASTHPGGGVWGASGRSAAGVLLRDRDRPRRGPLGAAAALGAAARRLRPAAGRPRP